MEADFVIVGAGSAGCVLAARLSEDVGTNVAVLEAGGSDRSIFIQMPSALSIPMNTKRYDWGFHTLAEPGLAGRRMHCPRGKVIGGSSSINGMVYARGHACDFDEWAEHGAAGWDYSHCLPYFRKAERWIGDADDYRGGNGPLAVSMGNEMRLNPLYGAFIEAGAQAGYPVTEDYNGYQQEGFGPMHMTVSNGKRCSAADAYLKPALSRPNLTLITHALINRVVIEDGRAIAVEYLRGGAVQTIRARREVILCAGAIGSPTILQRSGIGPGHVLQRAGVPVAADLPGVGANLQDHLEVYFQYACKQPITLNGKIGLLGKAIIGAQWLLFQSGLGATNHFEACAFIRSRAGLKWPDIQYHFLPAAMRYDGRAAIKGHGFQVHMGPNKPASRGHVAIRSGNPHDAPDIRFNYLQDERDRADWRAAIALTREIMAQPALDTFRAQEIAPGTDIASDDAVDRWVSENAESAYHPSCTCRMGRNDDPGAVLDASGRVRAMQGLRVVDSSVFPTITNANLNAPTIMLAERFADIIAGKPLLAASHAPVWIDPDWQLRQRPGNPSRLPDAA